MKIGNDGITIRQPLAGTKTSGDSRAPPIGGALRCAKAYKSSVVISI